MKTIHKYELQITATQKVFLPAGSTILTVQMQNGNACMWAMVDTDNEYEHITIDMFGTGHPMGWSGQRRYISTIQIEEGQLIFHVFYANR